MSDHKFKSGETLNYMPHRINFSVGPGKCRVVRLLSTEGEDPQYRVKCANENFERVVRESELH